MMCVILYTFLIMTSYTKNKNNRCIISRYFLITTIKDFQKRQPKAGVLHYRYKTPSETRPLVLN
jgi:hypothetical protein